MKMLKSKNIRRICVLLAMIAPAVYLFGSLFAGLTGAHGQEVFAEPVYVDQYVDVDNYAGDSVLDYRVEVKEGEGLDYQTYMASLITGSWGNVYASFTYEGHTCSRFYIYTNELVVFENRSNNEGYTLALVTGGVARFEPWYFYPLDNESLSVIWGNGDFTLQKRVSVPSSEVPENAGAYSDYVFKNFFAKDNFLEQIGKDVLSETPHGFVPFASFWKYLDENMLHMGDMQLGLMGYGYVYYCCHVLLFDIAFILVTFFLDFIQKVNDKIVGGVD